MAHDLWFVHSCSLPFIFGPVVTDTRIAAQDWYLELKKNVDKLQRVQKGATKMIKGLENVSYGERFPGQNLFSLSKKRLNGDSITTYK